jgi:hypothetical protein
MSGFSQPSGTPRLMQEKTLKSVLPSDLDNLALRDLRQIFGEQEAVPGSTIPATKLSIVMERIHGMPLFQSNKKLLRLYVEAFRDALEAKMVDVKLDQQSQTTMMEELSKWMQAGSPATTLTTTSETAPSVDSNTLAAPRAALLLRSTAAAAAPTKPRMSEIVLAEERDKEEKEAQKKAEKAKKAAEEKARKEIEERIKRRAQHAAFIANQKWEDDINPYLFWFRTTPVPDQWQAPAPIGSVFWFEFVQAIPDASPEVLATMAYVIPDTFMNHNASPYYPHRNTYCFINAYDSDEVLRAEYIAHLVSEYNRMHNRLDKIATKCTPFEPARAAPARAAQAVNDVPAAADTETAETPLASPNSVSAAAAADPTRAAPTRAAQAVNDVPAAADTETAETPLASPNSVSAAAAADPTTPPVPTKFVCKHLLLDGVTVCGFTCKTSEALASHKEKLSHNTQRDHHHQASATAAAGPPRTVDDFLSQISGKSAELAAMIPKLREKGYSVRNPYTPAEYDKMAARNRCAYMDSIPPLLCNGSLKDPRFCAKLYDMSVKASFEMFSLSYGSSKQMLKNFKRLCSDLEAASDPRAFTGAVLDLIVVFHNIISFVWSCSLLSDDSLESIYAVYDKTLKIVSRILSEGKDATFLQREEIIVDIKQILATKFCGKNILDNEYHPRIPHVTPKEVKYVCGGCKSKDHKHEFCPFGKPCDKCGIAGLYCGKQSDYGMARRCNPYWLHKWVLDAFAFLLAKNTHKDIELIKFMLFETLSGESCDKDLFREFQLLVCDCIRPNIQASDDTKLKAEVSADSRKFKELESVALSAFKNMKAVQAKYNELLSRLPPSANPQPAPSLLPEPSPSSTRFTYAQVSSPTFRSFASIVSKKVEVRSKFHVDLTMSEAEILDIYRRYLISHLNPTRKQMAEINLLGKNSLAKLKEAQNTVHEATRAVAQAENALSNAREELGASRRSAALAKAGLEKAQIARDTPIVGAAPAGSQNTAASSSNVAAPVVRRTSGNSWSRNGDIPPSPAPTKNNQTREWRKAAAAERHQAKVSIASDEVAKAEAALQLARTRQQEIAKLITPGSWSKSAAAECKTAAAAVANAEAALQLARQSATTLTQKPVDANEVLIKARENVTLTTGRVAAAELAVKELEKALRQAEFNLRKSHKLSAQALAVWKNMRNDFAMFKPISDKVEANYLPIYAVYNVLQAKKRVSATEQLYNKAVANAKVVHEKLMKTKQVLISKHKGISELQSWPIYARLIESAKANRDASYELSIQNGFEISAKNLFATNSIPLPLQQSHNGPTSTRHIEELKACKARKANAAAAAAAGISVADPLPIEVMMDPCAAAVAAANRAYDDAYDAASIAKDQATKALEDAELATESLQSYESSKKKAKIERTVKQAHSAAKIAEQAAHDASDALAIAQEAFENAKLAAASSDAELANAAVEVAEASADKARDAKTTAIDQALEANTMYKSITSPEFLAAHELNRQERRDVIEARRKEKASKATKDRVMTKTNKPSRG